MRRVDVDLIEELKVEAVKPERPAGNSTPIEPPKNPFNELKSDKYRSPLAEKIEDEEFTPTDTAKSIESKTEIPTEQPTEDNHKIPIIAPKKLEENEIPKAKVTSTLGPEWIRQELPSRCVPYDFSEVFLRPLSFKMLGKIHAANVSKSYTMLLDALSNCISQDIRDLTPEDLTFIMYWIRDNSYPRSPLKFRYETRYGNEIEFSVKKSSLEIIELEMTKEEYKEYQKQGLCFPTVRDAELLFGDAVDPDVRYLLEYAQYIKLTPEELRATEEDEELEDYEAYSQKKIDKIENDLGLDILFVIDNFSTKIKHGVVERAIIRDPKFKPNEAAEYLKNKALEVRERIINIPAITHSSDFDETVAMFLKLAEELEEEAADILNKLENNIKPLPKEEVVEVSITATDFFPSIR